MIQYRFKVKLYEEREYILYEKEDGEHNDVYLKPIHALYAMAHFVKSQITTEDGKTKTRYYLIYKEPDYGWTDQEKIAFQEACSYLEKLS